MAVPENQPLTAHWVSLPPAPSLGFIFLYLTCKECESVLDPPENEFVFYKITWPKNCNKQTHLLAGGVKWSSVRAFGGALVKHADYETELWEHLPLS